jgi:hypothetical protein
MILRCIIWRNNHCYDERLRRVVDREDAAALEIIGIQRQMLRPRSNALVSLRPSTEINAGRCTTGNEVKALAS